MTPDELARQNIDRQLHACGWLVQDRNAMNIYANLGVAVWEFPWTRAKLTTCSSLTASWRIRKACRSLMKLAEERYEDLQTALFYFGQLRRG
jgi:hypothetical protein